jgi:hypothetical protein
MSKLLIILLMSFTSLTAFADDNHSDLTILAGAGLTSNDLLGTNNYNNSANQHQFSKTGYLMGFEFAHDFGNSPIYWSGTFVTDDVFLLGTGIDLGIVRLGAKFGYGLSQLGDNGPDTPLDSSSYGWLVGASAEIMITPEFGISADYISNKSYLGGVSFHF